MLPVAPIKRRLRLVQRWRDPRAFSLVEAVMVCALISTVGALASAVYVAALKSSRVARAVADLDAIALDIEQFYLANERYPTTLTEARPIVPIDPWGRPYVYTDVSLPGSRGRARKDGRLNPINSDFDLYSVGEDGRTTTPLAAPVSRDDVIRARDGAFAGLAVDF